MTFSKRKEGERSDLMSFLEEISDPRVDRNKDHQLINLLMIGLCSTLCGGESFNDMETFGKAQFKWLSGFLDLSNGIPSHDTFNRIFRTLDPKQFMDVFMKWTQSLRTTFRKEVVALDGKALRRARTQEASIPYIVSAWASENGLTLGQVQVDEKSNEITAIPKLLQRLDVAGCIVTIDAMGCQKNIAKEILQAEADYLLALKGNQGTAHDEVTSFFDNLIPPDSEMKKITPPPSVGYLQTIDGDHGRIETRRYWISDDIHWFEDQKKWKGLQCFAMVESKRQVGETTSYERRCFLTSLEPNVYRFARACRGHWAVENPLHWVMDVTFHEDESRARTGHAPENLAALRRLALNLIKKESSQNKLSLRRKKLMAAWNNDYLEKVLSN